MSTLTDEERFMEALYQWLKRNCDPRLKETPSTVHIENLPGAAADFCRHMAEVTRKK